MQLNRKYPLYSIVLLLILSRVSAQEDAKTLYDGNNFYHSGKLPEASAKYARALELNPNNKKANFNLGNALYKTAMAIKQGNITDPSNPGVTPDSLSKMIFDKAAQNFAVVANSVSDKDTLHRAWHNIGNCYLQKKEYQQAADAYKKALKFDPKDEETRYNLAYALKHIPKQKKGGGGQSQQQQQQQKQDKKDEKQQQQQQQSQMSKEQAEQLLKAMMESEKKLQEKRKQKPEEMNKQQEKDW